LGGLIVVLLKMKRCGTVVVPEVVKGRSDFIIRVINCENPKMEALRFSETVGNTVPGKQHDVTEELNLQDFMNANERGNRITAHRVLHNLSALYCAEIEIQHTVCYIT
jgi:hypothetical protein